MASSLLARAFEVLNRLENIDARHHFTCCQNCGSAELQALENPDDTTIGYCFYHAQDSEAVKERNELHLSYGGYETPDEVWDCEDIAYIVQERLVDCGLEVHWNGDSDLRLKVLLDDDSIDFVVARSEGFVHGERVAYDWKYFDFAQEWDRFAKHWYHDEVQTILKDSIDQLEIDTERCVGSPNSYCTHKEPWEKGDALWQLSQTYYSFRLFRDEIVDGPDNPCKFYNRTMSLAYPFLCMKNVDRFVESEICERIVYTIARRKRGVRTLIYTNEDPFDESAGKWDHKDLPDKMTDPLNCTFFSFAGRAVLHNALKAVVRRMFPDQDFFEVCGHDNVEILVLPEQTIVFDLFGYYFWNHEKWPGFSTDNVVAMFRLNQMKSGLE